MANTRFKTENGLLVTGANSHFFDDVYVGNTSYNQISNPSVGSNLYVYGDLLYVAGNLHVIGDEIIGGNTIYNVNIVPGEDGLDLGSVDYQFDGHFANVIVYGFLNPVSNGINLGSSTRRWNLFANSIDVSGTSSLNTVSITGATTISNTLNVTRAVTFSNTLSVTGATNLSNTLIVTGATTLSNTLVTIGAVTFSNTLNITGATSIGGTLNVTRAVTFANTLNVAGAVNFSNTLNVFGNVNIANSLTILGNTTFSNNVVFNSNVTFISEVSLPGDLNFNSLSITNNLTLGGNINIDGSVHTINGNVNFDAGTLFIDGVNGRVGIGTTTPDTKLSIAGAANVTGRLYAGSLVVGGAGTIGGLFTADGNAIIGGSANVATVLRVGARGAESNGVISNNSTILLGNTSVYASLGPDDLLLRSLKDVSPGGLGNGQVKIVGSGYSGYMAMDSSGLHLGHNSISRNLTLDINETPRLTLQHNNQHTLTGSLNVTGTISGDASGLNNVNWIESVAVDADTNIATTGSPNVWTSGAAHTVTIPSGIDTVDVQIYLEILVEQTTTSASATDVGLATGTASLSGINVSGSVSGDYDAGGGTTSSTSLAGSATYSTDPGIRIVTDAGAGPGNPELRYRLLRDGVEVFISDWTQVSTAGSFVTALNTVRDGAPRTLPTHASTTYTFQYQWRKISSNPAASAGTITVSSGALRAVQGTGTNFQAFLGPRQSMVISGTAYSISEVLNPSLIVLETPLPGAVTGVAYTISDNLSVLKALQKRLILNFTGFRT